MVEANIRVHRWILISRVRDVDAAEVQIVGLNGHLCHIRRTV